MNHIVVGSSKRIITHLPLPIVYWKIGLRNSKNVLDNITSQTQIVQRKFCEVERIREKIEIFFHQYWCVQKSNGLTQCKVCPYMFAVVCRLLVPAISNMNRMNYIFGNRCYRCNYIIPRN